MSGLDIFVNLQLWVALGLIVFFSTYARAQPATAFTAPHLIAIAFFWPAFLVFYGLQCYALRLVRAACAAADPNHKLN